MIEERPPLYEFDDFRLDLRKRRLTRAGEVVALYSKAFDLLLVLVQSGGRDLTKDELLDLVWPGQELEESNLTVNMSAVRKALGEKAVQPHYIITVPGRGYRFVADVRARREMSGVLIESETVSQITIEEEEDETIGEEALVVNPDPGLIVQENLRTTDVIPTSITAKPEARQLASAQPSAKAFFQRRYVRTALALGLVLAVIAVLYAVRQRGASSATRFTKIKIRQLTNSGHIVNAALSPDGKFFVFATGERQGRSLSLGEIGGAELVTLRPAADVIYGGMTFSADGNSIYYAMSESGERHLALYRLRILGGIPEKLRDAIASHFTISPDNRRVAFARYDAANKTAGIIISDLDGANETVSTTIGAMRYLSDESLSWSPDGSTIAFGAVGDENGENRGLFILQIASGQVRPLTPPLWRSLVRISWLKDESGLIATAASIDQQETRQVWHIAYPGGEVRRITTDLNSYDIGLSVTADSNSLLLVQHQQINNIWVAPADDFSKARQVTFGAINRNEGALGLDWGPNGKIVYVSYIGLSKTIWIMDADGSNATELTQPNRFEATTPSITGDGRFIVFNSTGGLIDSNRSGGGEIWRVDVDGRNPKKLTTCAKNYQPTVSGDGKWVVYTSNCEAKGGLWRVSIEGGQPVLLTDKDCSWPWISPDSKSVACQDNSSATTKLAIVALEGNSPLKQFDVPPQANFRYSIRWTPDGQAITYRDWVKGIWRQPITGGPPQRIPGLPDEKLYAYGWSRDGKQFAFTRGVEIRDVVLISNVQ